MPPLLLKLWREQHPKGHEQTNLDFKVQRPAAATLPLFRDQGFGEMRLQYPVTPDGRYFVGKGRLWRCTNPSLSAEARQRLVGELMQARRAKSEAMRNADAVGREAARQKVDETKHQLGERGEVWWDNGAPDWNRHMVVNTPYADRFSVYSFSRTSVRLLRTGYS